MSQKHPGKVLLGAQNITKYFGAQPVLEGVSLTVHEGDRIGLIGRNGCGKTTLLKILSGAAEPDGGQVTRSQGIRVACLEQQCVPESGRAVQDLLFRAVREHQELIHAWRHATHDFAMSLEENAEHRLLRETLESLRRQLDASDAWNPEVAIKQVASSLRLPAMDRLLECLSGGEMRRVDLAAKLLTRPDVLLLDEPTNHIDTESIAWIERFLEGYAGACILVTHDRYFLDQVTNRIVELDLGRLYAFQGNYERFLEYKASVTDVLHRTEANRQALLRRELEWYQRMPKARGTKSKARIDRLLEAQENTPPPPPREFTFAIPQPERLGKDILETRQVAFGFGEKPLFSRVSLLMRKGMRVGLIGPNGCGKSTLLRVLMGEVTPDFGEVFVGQTTHFLYVDQTLSEMNPDQRVIDFLSGGARHWEVNGRRIFVPAYLESFLFDKSCADMPLGRLSGGERRRLDLAKKLLCGGNFLVLDEPTNDLDLYSLRVLEETVASFDGCALIVSHDRFLLNRLCTHVLVFRDDGEVVLITGNYQNYLAYRDYRQEQERKADSGGAARKAVVSKNACVAGPRRLNYMEKRELESIEADIIAAESKVAALESTLHQPGFYEQSHEIPQAHLAALETAQAEVERLYQRWQVLDAIR